MSINPVFCNIYLFNLSVMSFFLCVFVFHSVLLLVNSTLVIFVIPYEYFFCLLVRGINLLDWFPLQCAANLSHDLLLTFLFLSFSFLFFSSFLHLPTLSFPKLLATSQIKSLGFQPKFCFLKVYSFSSFIFVFWKQWFWITVLSILFHVSFYMFFLCVKNSFFVFCFFWVMVTVFGQFLQL